MIKALNLTEKYTILITVFLYPVIVLTSFVNNFETPKLLLLSISFLILSVTKILKIFTKESIEVNVTKFDIFMFLFGVAFLVSGIFSSPNQMDSFFLPANAGFVILSALTYFLINQSKAVEKQNILTALIASIFTVSVLQILSAVGITKIISFMPEIAKSKDFTPLGNLLNSTVITISILPIVIYKVFANKDVAEKILYSLVGTIIIISLVSSSYLLSKAKNTSIFSLDYKTGWSIAVDSIKESPLLGVGPSNFSYAFNKFRPITFNAGDNWNLKYQQNTGHFLNILSEIGIVGIILVIYLCFLFYKNSDFKNPIYVSSLILLMSILILPVSTSIFLILFILISVSQEVKSVKLGLFLNKIPKILISIPAAIALMTFLYFGARAFYAEYLFSKSVTSLNNNQGLMSYDLVNKAVSINPYVDRYHLFSSAINMVIAERLAQNENLTDDDRNNITKLIQQAIREGKASVAVNPKKSANWEALSDIYKTIIAFAQGSDVFAVESIRQSIALDPINPALRIKLGGLYYSLKQYDLAIETFKLAVLSKPDLPNAHYNLAMAYKANKDLVKAKEEMNITLNLLGKESADYEKAIKELQSIEELSQPTEKIEPVIEPQIELPTE